MLPADSHLTPDELAAVQHLHQRTPYIVTDVSRGMFSIARHAGGMTFNGCRYTYIAQTDECVRDDVMRAVVKLRRQKEGKHAPR